MLITSKRVLNIDRYLSPFKREQQIYVATKIEESLDNNLLMRAGFLEPSLTGVKIIPRALGPVSKFNSEGEDIPLKDQPKETYYRETCIKDWHGYYHYVDVADLRYRRKHIDAPLAEVSLVDINGDKYVVSDLLENKQTGKEAIKHVINLFLELFGRCTILGKDKAPLVEATPIKRANWQILPEGAIVWEKVSQTAGRIADDRELVGQMQKHRFNTIIRHHPDELYYGTGGFHGYLVFVFKRKNIVVMENMIYGNATYVFKDDWKELSKLSKAEIIHNNLQQSRLVHSEKWVGEISRLLV